VKKLLLFPLLIIVKTALSQTDTSIINFINPPVLAAPHGYAQTAQIDLGNCKMIIISGQVAFDNKGTLVGNGDFEKQAEQVFLNLKNTVESAGGSMDDIVKLGIYVIDMSQIQTLRAVRDKFVNVKHPPASTLVQVNKLFRDDVLIEVEATAIVPNKK